MGVPGGGTGVGVGVGVGVGLGEGVGVGVGVGLGVGVGVGVLFTSRTRIGDAQITKAQNATNKKIVTRTFA
jgi:hypothetical protein